MKKTVFLDLDDTILDFQKAEHAALQKTLKHLGIEPLASTLTRYSVINKRQWELLEEGKLTRQQVLHRRFEILFSELGVNVDAKTAQKKYESELSKGHYFVENAEWLLKELYSKHDLYLASNGTAVVQEGRIKSAGIAPYFKEIFISQNTGYVKPQKEFFDYCFERIPNFKREESIIIGDSLTSDIRGGNNAGIETCWFNPQGKERIEGILVDYEVRSLKEIPALLL